MPQDQVVARTAPDGGATAGRAPARRGELDLLRALVVVGLVFFHSAVIFGPGEFPVKAETEHLVATVFLAFGATWGMPLLFTISGMGIWYSLRSRGPARFARERLRRLGVPLLAGLLTLVPLQVWLGLRHSGDPAAGPGFTVRTVPGRRLPGRGRPADRPGVPAPLAGRHRARRAGVPGLRRGVRGGQHQR